MIHLQNSFDCITGTDYLQSNDVLFALAKGVFFENSDVAMYQTLPLNENKPRSSVVEYQVPVLYHKKDHEVNLEQPIMFPLFDDSVTRLYDCDCLYVKINRKSLPAKVIDVLAPQTIELVTGQTLHLRSSLVDKSEKKLCIYSAISKDVIRVVPDRGSVEVIPLNPGLRKLIAQFAVLHLYTK